MSTQLLPLMLHSLGLFAIGAIFSLLTSGVLALSPVAWVDEGGNKVQTRAWSGTEWTVAGWSAVSHDRIDVFWIDTSAGQRLLKWRSGLLVN